MSCNDFSLRKAVALNCEVLEEAAKLWAEVFDFTGSGSRPRTIPIKPTIVQAYCISKKWGDCNWSVVFCDISNF